MSNSNDEQYLDFLRYQEVEVKHVLPKNAYTVSKADHKAMAKAAKAQAKEVRKRGR